MSETRRGNEERAIQFAAGEVRLADDGERTLEGYAAVFDQPYDMGRFEEIISPGAFARSLESRADVRALIDHDPAKVIGRSKAGTLDLEEDDHGLRVRIRLADTTEAGDLAKKIERRDIDAMSIGFTAKRQRWAKDGERRIRFLDDVDLFDVSAVAFPASPTTEIALRSLAQQLEAESDQSEDMARRYRLMLASMRRFE